jgi:rhodanese-related sulfurtransferase
MPKGICRDQVRELAEQGAQLVEVLPAEDYEWKHIAGARSLPLIKLTLEAAASLDRDRPVVVYCHDYQ